VVLHWDVSDGGVWYCIGMCRMVVCGIAVCIVWVGRVV
jgi:hypothetical protein